MQSYLKYKDYYDRKATAAPLKKRDSCFILQPKADSQASKTPFKDFRWIGPFVIRKVSSNDNYIVRRVNTNKTQIIHRIRLKKIVPHTPLEDNYSGEKLQPDEEIVIPQDDLYTLLRLFTGVILREVAVVLFLIGVEVAFSRMFSDSESVSSAAVMMVWFLTGGAISFSISFWFSAKILVRSDMIFFSELF